MWLAYAAGSAVFAGLTAILAKIGIRKTDSTVATAIRTVVVLVMSWAMVFVVGSQGTLGQIDGRSLAFLGLSGLATGASWLCYFRALKLGNVNHVAPIDKLSTVLTILLAFLLLGEPFGAAQGFGMALIGVGTLLMVTGRAGEAGRVDRRELGFICLSGLATGGSWLCYYKALQEGPASIVVPIDKLSILLVVLFARIVLGERLSRKAGAGLALLTAGTLVLALPLGR